MYLSLRFIQRPSDKETRTFRTGAQCAFHWKKGSSEFHNRYVYDIAHWLQERNKLFCPNNTFTHKHTRNFKWSQARVTFVDFSIFNLTIKDYNLTNLRKIYGRPICVETLSAIVAHKASSVPNFTANILNKTFFSNDR